MTALITVGSNTRRARQIFGCFSCGICPYQKKHRASSNFAWPWPGKTCQRRPKSSLGFLCDSAGFQLVPELMPLSSEVIFDKITMSAFEGTPLDIALRDCAINSFIIVGVATEIGIEPTIRHGSDLGYIPIMVTDACGAGDQVAGERALASIEFTGDAMLTDTQTICNVLAKVPVH